MIRNVKFSSVGIKTRENDLLQSNETSLLPAACCHGHYVPQKLVPDS